MTKFTKADIDGLVDGLNCDAVRSQPMPAQTFSCFAPMIGCYRRAILPHMPDHPVIPRQFRDALDTFAAVVRGHYTGPFPSAASEARGLEAMKAARAEVERLYAARVGEEYEVEMLSFYAGHGPGIAFAEDDEQFKPGDRVFVTKGEAG